MTTESNEEQVTASSAIMTTEELLGILSVTPIHQTNREQLDHMVDAALAILRNEPPLPPLMTDAELAEPKAETEEDEEELSKVDAFIERMKNEDHTELVSELDSMDGDLRQDIIEEAEVLFSSGTLSKGYLLAHYKLNHRGYLSDQSLHRLRSFWSHFEDADDWDDIKGMLEDDFGVVYCDDCGEPEFNDETRRTYTDDDVCRECIANNYRWSEYYDCYISEDSSRWALDEEGGEVLIHENDSDFHWNEEADQYTHVDYEYEPPEPEIIGNYHSSKSRIRLRQDDWTKQHKRFFGVELEVEVKGDHTRGDVAQRIHDLVNDGEFYKNIFIERDGSLSNGFEMITHPMSLPAHRELWSFLQSKDAIKGLRSHNTTTCGLHVHVNRAGLSSLQIAKIVTFVNSRDNEQLIRAVARRYADGYCKIKSKGIGESAKSSDRYEAVNITPSKTIEFRIFKGSLKYESVISAIEFSHALTEFCKPSVTSIKDLTTEKFLDFCTKELPEETQILRPYVAARIEND